jgi:protein SCO1/2
MTRRLLLVLVAVLLGAAGLAGCTSSSGSKAPASTAAPSGLNDQTGSGPYEGIGLQPPQPRPAFTLTDTSGTTFDFSKQTNGHPTLLYFGYTSCPDACPETMANIQLAVASLPTALQQSTYVVFVTTDVVHDTAPVIAEWLSHFSIGTHAHIVGLRGTQAQINAAEASAKIPLASDGGQTHSTELLLFGADNYARVVYALTNPVTQQQTQIAHDLPLVAKA